MMASGKNYSGRKKKKLKVKEIDAAKKVSLID